MTSFQLDPRLEADGPVVAELPLCQVRLVDDARFVWLVLIPRRDGLMEIFDIPAPERAVLMEEIAAVGAAVKAASGCAKLNVAALGNMVRQLHVHVMGRDPGDPAWPGPVFGFGAREPLAPEAMAERLATLRSALAS
ncbi:HIT domain-containing protein [Xanthobacter tagetidis]|uniref:HIT domain-containing protein n=1 Tax=Xanthobacter tagetidis TaxID=60216 RepID=A0A3L7A7W5_9HYPH|nr:HIT family protein [Xanthobacter tagetidis]MBB6308395.1 diadenosine tetraphosphate (Ap4A) HIT family hydrolase [Xanthobacter tagetidis]RLP76257.1 HIT domain-containing protein [Xanthobacter tagetidis]